MKVDRDHDLLYGVEGGSRSNNKVRGKTSIYTRDSPSSRGTVLKYVYLLYG